MNFNSLFNSLLKVKNQLKGSISKQDGILTTLLYGVQPDLTEDHDYAVSKAISVFDRIVLNTGEVASIQKGADANSLYVTLTSKSDGDSEVITVNLPDSGLDSEQLDSTLSEGYQTTLRDIIISLSEGESINEVINTVNTMFLNKPTYTVGEIMQVIQSLDVNTTVDIKQFKQMLINSANNGEVSNYAWAELLSYIMKDSAANVNNDETFVVKKENFFALQSFMSTVLNIVSLTFNIILSVVGAIFGGLWLALVFIVQNAVNIFSQVFDTNIKMNVNATYPGVTGTFRASSIPSTIYLGSNFETNNLMRIPSGPEDIFFFTQKDSSDEYKTYCQSQMILYYHPERLLQYLHRSFVSDIVYDSVVSAYSFRSTKPLTPWSPDTSDDDYIDPRLTADEYVTLASDPDFLKRTLVANVMMLYIHRVHGISSKSAIDTMIRLRGYYDFMTATVDSNFDDHIYPNEPAAFIAIALGSALYYYDGDMTKWNTFLSGVPQSNINGWINNFVNISNDDSDHVKTYAGSLINQLGSLFLITTPLYYGAGFSKDGLFSSLLTNGKIQYNFDQSNLDICDVDFIPTEDFVNLPSYSSEQVLAAVGLIVAVITTATIAAKKLGSAVRSRIQLLKTKRVANLNTLREQYLSNPTDRTAEAAYLKALRSYNFKASIFGWGSYDAANGWIESGDGSSTTMETINNITSNSGWENIRKLISGK